MLLTDMCVTVSGDSSVKGANIVLYADNGSNAQKFQITETTSGVWSIVSASSSQYVAVSASIAADGRNVVQFTATGADGQKWKFVDTGTTATIDGATCKVVTIGSYVTGDGATYLLDVANAMATNSSNIQIYTSDSSDAQKFALYPTTRRDESMPVPAAVGWSKTLGGADAQMVYPSNATLYPAWSFTDAWNGLSGHGFEYSYRSRNVPVDSANPDDWSSWSAWSSASVTRYGQTAWLTSGLTGSFNTTNYKALEYSVRVRSTATIGGVVYHSYGMNMLLRSVAAPTVSVTQAQLGADAITLTISTNYTGGLNTVNVLSVQNSTGTEFLAVPTSGSGYGSSFTLDIPIENLASVPATGSALNITFDVGTDQYTAFSTVTSSSVTYSNKSSKSVTVSPTLTYNADGTATLTVSAGTSRFAWLSVDGKTIQLVPKTATTFVLPYPFGVECKYYVGVFGSGSAWGNASGTITANDSNKIRPCHAFNWDGGYFLLEVASGIMQTSRTIRADYSTFNLNNRDWQSLRFGNTLGGEFTAEGVLKSGLTTSDKAALMALVRAHDVLYRSPTGEVANVGITDVSYQTVRNRTMVTVSMVQVSR